MVKNIFLYIKLTIGFFIFLFIFLFFARNSYAAPNYYDETGATTCSCPGSPLYLACYNDGIPGAGSNCGTGCNGGISWQHYSFTGRCIKWPWNECGYLFLPQAAICSTGDKYNTSNPPVLKYGTCSCTTGTDYKTCCNNGSPVNASIVGPPINDNKGDEEAGCGSYTTQFCGFAGYPACGAPACGPPPTPTPIPIPIPGGLSQSCPLPGTTGTVSWTSVPSVDHYALRIDYTANNSGSCTDGWLCDSKDIAIDTNTNPYTFTSIAGASYDWWVHACSTTTCSAASVKNSFTCIAPTVSVTLEGRKSGTSDPWSSVDVTGVIPLNFDLKATVGGTATGNIRYHTACRIGSGLWSADVTVPDNPYYFNNNCSYGQAWNDNARIEVTRQGITASDDLSVIATTPGTISGYVYSDSVDCIVNGTESILSGKGVRLVDWGTKSTNASGYYSFGTAEGIVVPSTRTVDLPSIPVGYTLASCNTQSRTISLTSGSPSSSNNNFYLVPNSTPTPTTAVASPTPTPPCSAGQSKPHDACSGGSCISINSCGYGSCTLDSDCIVPTPMVPHIDGHVYIDYGGNDILDCQSGYPCDEYYTGTTDAEVYIQDTITGPPYWQRAMSPNSAGYFLFDLSSGPYTTYRLWYNRIPSSYVGSGTPKSIVHSSSSRYHTQDLGLKPNPTPIPPTPVPTTYTISGTIFIDDGAGGGTAGDGIRGPGEGVYPGTPVTMAVDGDYLNQIAVGLINGAYSIPNFLGSRDHTLDFSVPADYIYSYTGTDPNYVTPRTVTVTTADVAGVNFGIIPTYLLTVVKDGTGTGTVTSSPAGINCGTDCTETYNSGTSVTLTAAPSIGSIVGGWSGGGCSGTGLTCTVTMDAAKTVTVTFTLPATYTISGNVFIDSGSGTPAYDNNGVQNCIGACDNGAGDEVNYTASVPTIKIDTVNPTTNTGGAYTFAGLAGSSTYFVQLTVPTGYVLSFGGINPNSNPRSVDVTTSNVSNVNFGIILPVYPLTVTKAGTGTGTVTSSPAGINCGSTCSFSYTSGQVVVLTAAANAGSTFSGWSGDADCSDGSVTMSAARNCTATFTLNTYTISGNVFIDSGSGTATNTNNGVQNCSGICDNGAGDELNYTALPVPTIQIGAVNPTTNTGGAYSFAGLLGSTTYDVQLTVPTNYILSNIGGIPNSNTNPRSVTVLAAPVPNQNFGIIVPCTVTTSPSSLPLTVGGATGNVDALVTSGLGSATITQMSFGSYNTAIATVNPASDSTSFYETTVTAVAAGSTAVWATATLSDGRTCQSSSTTDTDIPVSATPTYTISGNVFIDSGSGTATNTNNGVQNCSGICDNGAGDELNYTALPVPTIQIGAVNPTTNTGGAYSFAGLLGSTTYDVQLTVPTNYILSNIGGIPNSNTNPRSVTVLAAPVPNQNFGIIVPCTVTTSPSSLPLTVGGATGNVDALVTSGLGSATITQMSFGSYNTAIATVNPASDSTSFYETTVTAVAAGSTAVWATATLSDGRTCGSTSTTDTDINVNTPTYTISGQQMVDTNGNGQYDSGEPALSGNFQVTFLKDDNSFGGGTSGNSYTISGPAGAYSLSYTSARPSGYLVSYPSTLAYNSVVVGTPPLCNVGGSGAAAGATCDASGNISGLNFGFKLPGPWIQTGGTDIRSDPSGGGLQTIIPSTANPSLCVSPFGNLFTSVNGVGDSPGIIFTGDTPAYFGTGGGSASAPNWKVGSSTYPDIYTPSKGSYATSYAFVLGRVIQRGISTSLLSSQCNLASCSLPAALPSGVYTANGNVKILNGAAYDLGGTKKVIILIYGDLTLAPAVNGISITVPKTSSLTFIVSGDIHVDKGVGTVWNSAATQVEGFYSTDKSFIIDGGNVCPSADLRLNMAGSVIVNAGGTGGRFINNRTLCANNAFCPVFTISERPDFILNAPESIKQIKTIYQEVAP